MGVVGLHGTGLKRSDCIKIALKGLKETDIYKEYLFHLKKLMII